MNPAPPVTRTVLTRTTLVADRRRCRARCAPRARAGGAHARDHRGVVRAELQRRVEDLQARGLAGRLAAARAAACSRPRRRPAARWATPTSLAAAIVFVTCTSTTASWNDAATSGRSRSRPAARSRLHVAQHRRLEPAQREVVVAGVLHRAREPDRVGIALARHAVERGTAREPQADHAAPPCRTPRPPRRRASGPAPRGGTSPGCARASCGRRSRPARRRAAPAGRARGSSPRRGPPGGSRRRGRRPVASATALPAAIPTSSAPTRPGPDGDGDVVEVAEADARALRAPPPSAG